MHVLFLAIEHNPTIVITVLFNLVKILLNVISENVMVFCYSLKLQTYKLLAM